MPLPWDPEHVTYVWFDALFNYCTAVGYGDDRARFDRYWPADYQIVGKDIVRFHAVYWPAMLMAAGEALPKCVFAHGFLLVGGEKMSKTGLNQIAPADLVRTFGSDGFRYHFLADQRFGPDGDFSFEAMVARYNADLANNFGNLANRVLNMAVNYCDGVAPEARAAGPLVAAVERAFAENTRHLERVDYASAYGAVWELIGAANSYIEDSEPWKLHKAGEAEAVDGVLGDFLVQLPQSLLPLLDGPALGLDAEFFRFHVGGEFLQAKLEASAFLLELDFLGGKFFQPDNIALFLQIERVDFVAHTAQLLRGSKRFTLRGAQGFLAGLQFRLHLLQGLAL